MTSSQVRVQIPSPLQAIFFVLSSIPPFRPPFLFPHIKALSSTMEALSTSGVLPPPASTQPWEMKWQLLGILKTYCRHTWKLMRLYLETCPEILLQCLRNTLRGPTTVVIMGLRKLRKFTRGAKFTYFEPFWWLWGDFLKPLARTSSPSPPPDNGEEV